MVVLMPQLWARHPDSRSLLDWVPKVSVTLLLAAAPLGAPVDEPHHSLFCVDLNFILIFVVKLVTVKVEDSMYGRFELCKHGSDGFFQSSKLFLESPVCSRSFSRCQRVISRTSVLREH